MAELIFYDLWNTAEINIYEEHYHGQGWLLLSESCSQVIGRAHSSELTAWEHKPGDHINKVREK